MGGLLPAHEFEFFACTFGLLLRFPRQITGDGEQNER